MKNWWAYGNPVLLIGSCFLKIEHKDHDFRRCKLFEPLTISSCAFTYLSPTDLRALIANLIFLALRQIHLRHQRHHFIPPCHLFVCHIRVPEYPTGSYWYKKEFCGMGAFQVASLSIIINLFDTQKHQCTVDQLRDWRASRNFPFSSSSTLLSSYAASAKTRLNWCLFASKSAWFCSSRLKRQL